ncbi:hypothetical protein AK88_00262 [Plasmodium fragile]|uniref:Uncharacterized protein n=1 Tax=Plasmodium fragile TaxID=5857 RepID=A0A0D9QT14_PLAFR|nr:uncharacterized protein AK88_00262 [Plasmodium fragile]KJP90093.1 hypothetical protein AK88_00262 [Plasmodium fragile]
MKAAPEIDLLPPKGGIEQGKHPHGLKKKNSKIISYLKNESQINVLLSKIKEKNGVNFFKNNQSEKFSLNEDKKKEVTLYNHLSNLSYTQPSEKSLNEKKGHIYMHRKYTSERDNAPMSSPPGKKKRTEKSTLLHRLVTLTSDQATQKAHVHVNSHVGEVKHNDIRSEGKKIITNEYKSSKMKAKKYSTLKYNIFVKGLKNIDNATEGRNNSFPKEEPTIINNNINNKKNQYAERNEKFNCDDLLQIYEHRYLLHIFKNSKNVPHKEIKMISNADYVQGAKTRNSGEHQLSNGTKDNNLDKSEAGINGHHSMYHIRNLNDGKYGKDTVLKRNLNEEITTSGDGTYSRYSSCHANGVKNANVQSNNADDPLHELGSALAKDDNATALNGQCNHFASRHIKDPLRCINLRTEKIPNGGQSDSGEMGNSWGNNTEKENKNNTNYSNVQKNVYKDASQLELLQNGIHKKIERLSSENCTRGELLVAPLTRNKPEQSGNSWEEKDNPTCILPNIMQTEKEEGEKITYDPNAMENLIKNILIKEFKNQDYYRIIKMEQEAKNIFPEYEHRQSHKAKIYKLGSNNRFGTPTGESHLFASCPPSFNPNTSSSHKQKKIDSQNKPETEVIEEKPPTNDNHVEHENKQEEEVLKEEDNKIPLSGSKKNNENEEKTGNNKCAILKNVDMNRADKQIKLVKGDANNGYVSNEEKRKIRDASKDTTNVSAPKLVIHKIDSKNSKEYISIKIENKPSAVKKCKLEKSSKIGKQNSEKKKVHNGKRGLQQCLPSEGTQNSTVKQSTDDPWGGVKSSSSTEGESKCAQNCAPTPPPNCSPNCPPNEPNSALNWTTWRTRLFPLFRIENNRIYADKNSRAYTTLTDHINDSICKIFRTQKRLLIFHIVLYSVNLLIFYALLQSDFLLDQERGINTKATMCILYILIAELYILFLNNAFYFFFKNQIKNAIFSLDRVNLIHIMSKLFPQYSSFFKEKFSVHEKNGNSFCKELEGHQKGGHNEKALTAEEQFTNSYNNWSIKKKTSVRFADSEILDKLKNGHHNVTKAEYNHERYVHHSGGGSTSKNAPTMNGNNLVLLPNMRGALTHSFFNPSNAPPYGTDSKQTQPHNSLIVQGNYPCSFEQDGQNDKVQYTASGEAHRIKSTESENITTVTHFILNEQRKNILNRFFFFKLRQYFNLFIILFASLLIHITIFVEIKDPFHFHVKTNLFFFIFVSFIILLQVLICIMAEIEEIFIQKMKTLLNKRVTFLDYQLAMYLGLQH